MKYLTKAIILCLTISCNIIYGGRLPGEEHGPVPGLPWDRMTPEQREEAYRNREKELERKPSRFVGRVLPPRYLDIFAQCDRAINESSSQGEIQAALQNLKGYKDSEEVSNFVETFAQDPQPLSYDELAAKGPEPIQRGTFWVVNIPGKIEDYLKKLNEQLSKRTNE